MPLFRNIQKLTRDESAATAIEYVLMASAVAGALVIIVFSIGDTMNEMFSSFYDALVQ